MAGPNCGFLNSAYDSAPPRLRKFRFHNSTTPQTVEIRNFETDRQRPARADGPDGIVDQAGNRPVGQRSRPFLLTSTHMRLATTVIRQYCFRRHILRLQRGRSGGEDRPIAGFPQFFRRLISVAEMDIAYQSPNEFQTHGSNGNTMPSSSSDGWRSEPQNGSGSPFGSSRSGVRRTDSAKDFEAQ